jgi:hypothetical protein
MSQLTHPSVSLRTAVRSRQALVLAALLALAATAAIVLVLAVGGSSGGPNSTSLPASNHYPLPGVRYDGGPEEGSSAATGPNVRYDGGPDEGSYSAQAAVGSQAGTAVTGARLDHRGLKYHAPSQASGQRRPNVRYDGGPEEGSAASAISRHR